MHYHYNNLKDILDNIRNLILLENIEITIITKLQYELEYFVRNKDFDIIIIDPNYIHSNRNGIYIAERVKLINRNVHIIFISDSINNELMIRMIDTEAFAFIPFNQISTKLPISIDRAISIINSDAKYEYIKRNEKYYMPLKNIIYFASSHRTIQFICIDGKEDNFYERMDNVENTISQITSNFVRVNQSYLINTRYILSINRNNIKMINGEIITVSRKYHSNLEVIRNIR